MQLDVLWASGVKEVGIWSAEVGTEPRFTDPEIITVKINALALPILSRKLTIFIGNASQKLDRKACGMQRDLQIALSQKVQKQPQTLGAAQKPGQNSTRSGEFAYFRTTTSSFYNSFCLLYNLAQKAKNLL